MQFKTVKQFVMSSGEKFESLEEAQVAELAEILAVPNDELSTAFAISKRILKEKARIMDVLSLTERSIPKARAINGGKKQRKRQVDPLANLPRIETNGATEHGHEAQAQAETA